MPAPATLASRRSSRRAARRSGARRVVRQPWPAGARAVRVRAGGFGQVHAASPAGALRAPPGVHAARRRSPRFALVGGRRRTLGVSAGRRARARVRARLPTSPCGRLAGTWLFAHRLDDVQGLPNVGLSRLRTIRSDFGGRARHIRTRRAGASRGHSGRRQSGSIHPRSASSRSDEASVLNRGGTAVAVISRAAEHAPVYGAAGASLAVAWPVPARWMPCVDGTRRHALSRRRPPRAGGARFAAGHRRVVAPRRVGRRGRGLAGARGVAAETWTSPRRQGGRRRRARVVPESARRSVVDWRGRCSPARRWSISGDSTRRKRCSRPR